MAFSSEIRFKIGGDISSLSKAFVGAESVAAAAGRRIERSFGLKEAFKGVFLSLGLGVEKLSEKFAAMFTGGKQEAWIKGLESASEVTNLIIERNLKRLDTERQLAALQKELNLAVGESDPKKRAGDVPFYLKFLPMGPQTRAAVSRANGESDAEAFERSQEAGKRVLQIQKQIEEVKKSGEEIDNRVEKSREKVTESSQTDADKLETTLQDAEEIQNKITAAKVRTNEIKELEIQFNEKIASANALQLKIEKDKTEAIEENTKKLQEQYSEREREEHRIGELQGQRAKAMHDQLGFSVDEAASGKRGNNSDRSRAKEIQRLERRAKQIYDRNEHIYDPSGQFEMSGEMLQNRANSLRQGFKRLTTSEQDPMAGIDAKLAEQITLLARIDASLKTVGDLEE